MPSTAYVLIVAFWTHQGMVGTTAQFGSKSACDNAITKLHEGAATHYEGSGYMVREAYTAVCVAAY